VTDIGFSLILSGDGNLWRVNSQKPDLIDALHARLCARIHRAKMDRGVRSKLGKYTTVTDLCFC